MNNMEREYKFIKFLSEDGDSERLITVDASDKNAAKREVEQSSRKSANQLKSQERQDAVAKAAEANAESNPQLKGLKVRRANLMKQVAAVNDQIARIQRSEK